MNSWMIALKGFKHRPLSAFLSLSLLSFGLGLILVLLAAQKQLENTFTQNIKGIDLVVGAKGSPLQLILSSVYHVDAPTGNIELKAFKKLAQNPMVKKAIPLSYGDSYKGFRIVGTNLKYPRHYQAKLAKGKNFSKAFEVTVGATVAQKQNLKLGQTFYGNHGLDGHGDGHDHHAFKIVGIYQATGTVLDQLILTPLESVWQVHQHGPPSTPAPPKEITAGLLTFSSPMATMMLPRNINKNTAMQAALPAIEINRLFTLAKSAVQLLTALAYLLMLLAAISVFTALYQSLQEEQPQLAFLRAIGASPGKIFGLIVTKGLVIGLAGFLLAVLLSQLALWLMANFLENTYHFTLSSSLLNLNTLYLFFATLALVLLASVGPAIRAYRLNISKTLAHA
jgi:putative ABC transport system permease protein